LLHVVNGCLEESCQGCRLPPLPRRVHKARRLGRQHVAIAASTRIVRIPLTVNVPRLVTVPDPSAAVAVVLMVSTSATVSFVFSNTT
jgi:hypothetical protein